MKVILDEFSCNEYTNQDILLVELPPMTNEESLACLAKMHNPTLEPYARYQARNELIEGNLHHATWAARRYKSAIPLDDRVQAARVVLIQAIDTMKADSFSTGPWVPGVARATGSIASYIKAAMYSGLVTMAVKDRGLPAPLRQQYGHHAANTAPFATPDAALVREARQQRILATFVTAWPRLTRHEEDVLRVMYGLATGYGLSMTETAIDLNLSLVRVRTLRDSAVRKIKSGLKRLADRDAA